jgi:hypothetical protein
VRAGPRHLPRHDVRYFFYIGGNDSAETAHILNELAVAEGYDVRVFHVPKTIDNDLRATTTARAMDRRRASWLLPSSGTTRTIAACRASRSTS